MLIQNFVKGGSERISYGYYEYVSGADIVFDFGNPTCTSAFSTSNIVFNVGTANVTASLIPYNNPGPFYPILETGAGAAGGSVIFKRQALADTNRMQWTWKTTKEQTNIFIYKPEDAAANSGEMGFPGAGAVSGSANSLYVNLNTSYQIFGGAFNSSNTQFDDIFGTPVLQTGSVEGRNGWNVVNYTSNGDSSSNLYLNQSNPILSTTTITRVDSASQVYNFPFRSGFTSNNFSSRIIAYLQYPFVLTPAQIRQTYKVFSQRFFL
jgi:hypothetical protein